MVPVLLLKAKSDEIELTDLISIQCSFPEKEPPWFQRTSEAHDSAITFLFDFEVLHKTGKVEVQSSTDSDPANDVPFFLQQMSSA